MNYSNSNELLWKIHIILIKSLAHYRVFFLRHIIYSNVFQILGKNCGMCTLLLGMSKYIYFQILITCFYQYTAINIDLISSGGRGKSKNKY